MMDFKVVESGQMDVRISRVWEEQGIYYAEIRMHSETPAVPKKFSIAWEIPTVDIFSAWNSGIKHDRVLAPNWRKNGVDARLASKMPVHSLFSLSGMNRMTAAISDAAVPTALRTGVREETGMMECRADIFTQPTAALTDYTCVLRVDMREIPYYKAVQQAAEWWEKDCGYRPINVPDAARQPVDSLWYSFHQELSTEEILKECRASAALGMKTVIIDDGWQTDDNHRGYTFCGDWELATNKIPDMAALADALHALDMKLMIWYSVPFVGSNSKVFQRFEDKMLSKRNERMGVVGVLDPRYPEVREYLVATYSDAVRKWHLDGLKLDFIESFALTDSDRADPLRDCTSLEEGIDRLMKAVYASLSAINPDILIEFRQGYVGPGTRQYANMLRVGDCPDNPFVHRRAVVDLRLTSGKTAVHSDMLMWHPDEKPEAIAVQFASALYSVPQISVRVDRLPEKQYKTLQFYLNFWRQYRDVLLDGDFSAMNPEICYSQICAEKEGTAIITVHANPVVGHAAQHLFIVNASGQEQLYFKNGARRRYRIRNCMGELLSEGRIEDALHEFRMPVGGILQIEN